MPGLLKFSLKKGTNNSVKTEATESSGSSAPAASSALAAAKKAAVNQVFTDEPDEATTGPRHFPSLSELRTDKLAEKKRQELLKEDPKIFSYGDDDEDSLLEEDEGREGGEGGGVRARGSKAASKDGAGAAAAGEGEEASAAPEKPPCGLVYVPTAESKKRPRYIKALLDRADHRELEQEIIQERILKKEREAEGDEYADKEEFVTGGYKRELERRAKYQEEVERAEEREAKKPKQLTSFHRQLLEGRSAVENRGGNKD
eukprot:GHVU01086605.1.p1 GENE.GHVU01086605.1~~GHVU01086605.1.p1  ORF type:complete len:259 (+),score=70.67 GHVU01086605.1:487-1263(+)